jgi:WD40 repeat protein
MHDVAAMLRSAKQALSQGDHATALPLLRQAVRVLPESFTGHMLLGVCLWMDGQGDEGLRELRLALEVNPLSVQGHYNLGTMLASSGRIEDARHHFATALRLDPEHRKSAEWLHAIHTPMGTTQAPLTQARKAVGASPPLETPAAAPILYDNGPGPASTEQGAAASSPEALSYSVEGLPADATEPMPAGTEQGAAASSPEAPSHLGGALPAVPAEPPARQVAASLPVPRPGRPPRTADASQYSLGSAEDGRLLRALFVGVLWGTPFLFLFDLAYLLLSRPGHKAPMAIVLLAIAANASLAGGFTGISAALASDARVPIGAGAAAVAFVNVVALLLADAPSALTPAAGSALFISLLRWLLSGALTGWVIGSHVFRIRSSALSWPWLPRASDLDQAPLGRSQLEPKTLNRQWALPLVLGLLIAAAGGWFTRPKRVSSVVWRSPVALSSLAFSPDAKIIAGAGAGVTLWRVADGAKLRTLAEPAETVADLAFSPTGQLLAAAGSREGGSKTVKLWRVKDGALVGAFPASAGGGPVAFSPDGKLLALGTDYLSQARPLGIQLWSVSDRKLVRGVARPEVPESGYVTSVAFSRDSKLIASGDDTGIVTISRVSDGEVVKRIDTANLLFVAVAFSPDGQLLGFGGLSGPSVTLWSVASQKEVRTLAARSREKGESGRRLAVNKLDFSHNGKFLAASESAVDLARVEVFAVRDGRRVLAVDARPTAAARIAKGSSVSPGVRSVQFSPDGKYLAWCGSGGVTVRRVTW